MKLLAIHNGDNASAVDIWRILRPVRELKKHTDWEITERPSLIKEIAKYKNAKEFTEAELQTAYDDLKQFDVIWASYSSFLNPTLFILCYMLYKKEGVRLVIDVDDNIYRINPDNLGWWLKMTHDKTWDLQTMVSKTPFLTTSTELLANELRKRRGELPESVKIIPNYISKDYPVCFPDNGDGVRIGYFGSASHLADTHSTGFGEALEKIMHEHKNIRAYSVGLPFEFYLPKARYEYIEGKKSHAWYKEVFPSLKFDISCAPLTSSSFNNSKSNIKWQESALMGATFVGSNLPPYAATVHKGIDGLLVKNTEEDWYKALKKLVEDKEYRQKLAKTAQKRVIDEFYIENNWRVIKEIFEGIYEAKR